MGGSTQQVQNSSNTNSQTGTQTGQMTPWGPSSGLLAQLLGQAGGVNANLTGAESGALDALSARGAAGNPFASQIGGVANQLLSGGPDRSGILTGAYGNLQSQLGGTANGQYLDPNTNPFFAQTTQGITDQTIKALKGIYAGAGRDPGGAGGDFQYNAGQGIAQATAPIYAQQYNNERTNQLNAASALFGGGQQTASGLSMLDQARAGQMQAGIGAAGSAWDASNSGNLQVLAAEAQRRGIPLQTLAQQFGIALPAAQAFGTTTGSSSSYGTGTGTQTTETQVPLLQQLIGGAAIGAGLYGKFGSPTGLGSSLFSGLSNGFMGPGSFNGSK